MTLLLVFGQAILSPAANDGTLNPSDQGKYPVPERSDKLLFYVQRSHNRNTVIYELNFQPDGKLDRKEPLHPSWIRYEEGGIRKELSYIQNRVYGLDVKTVKKDTYQIRFRSYKKRAVYLMPSDNGKRYKAMISINGKIAELTCLFICSVTNALGIPSTVKYIDINGIDPETGNMVTERVIP